MDVPIHLVNLSTREKIEMRWKGRTTGHTTCRLFFEAEPATHYQQSLAGRRWTALDPFGLDASQSLEHLLSSHEWHATIAVLAKNETSSRAYIPMESLVPCTLGILLSQILPGRS